MTTVGINCFTATVSETTNPAHLLRPNDFFLGNKFSLLKHFSVDEVELASAVYTINKKTGDIKTRV